MAAGMLSVIVVICIGILILSGWCNIIFPGLSPLTVITILILWMVCAGRDLYLYGVHIDIAWAVWNIIAIGCLYYGRHQKVPATYALLFGHIFLLTVGWLFVEVERGSGLHLVPAIAPWIVSIGFGLIVAILYESLADQWGVITLSYAFGELLLQWKVQSTTSIAFGSMSMFDGWWISFVIIRLYSVFSVYIVRFTRPRVDNH